MNQLKQFMYLRVQFYKYSEDLYRVKNNVLFSSDQVLLKYLKKMFKNILSLNLIFIEYCNTI